MDSRLCGSDKLIDLLEPLCIIETILLNSFLHDTKRGKLMTEKILPKNGRSQILPWILVGLGAALVVISGALWLNGRSSTDTTHDDIPVSAEITENENDNGSTNDFVKLALNQAGQGDVEAALESLDVAIASDVSAAAEAYYYKGIIYAEQAEYADALNAFESGIAANPHMPELFAARATTYATMGRPATALEDFNQAVELDPDYAPTYVNRGQAFLNMGEPDLAMDDFNYALELNPELTAAYFNRGVLYLEKAENDAALEDFHKAIEFSPDAPAPYFNRAVAYMNLNNLPAAAADLTIYIGMTDDEEGKHQAEALLGSLVEYEAQEENSHIGDTSDEDASSD